jgi:hypothetical protein
MRLRDRLKPFYAFALLEATLASIIAPAGWPVPIGLAQVGALVNLSTESSLVPVAVLGPLVGLGATVVAACSKGTTARRWWMILMATAMLAGFLRSTAIGREEMWELYFVQPDVGHWMLCSFAPTLFTLECAAVIAFNGYQLAKGALKRASAGP